MVYKKNNKKTKKKKKHATLQERHMRGIYTNTAVKRRTIADIWKYGVYVRQLMISMVTFWILKISLIDPAAVE